MELRQLKYFVTTARNLNFSEAARQLFITQGTLSQQIRQLEDELGSQLFERTTHSVSLTEAGIELLPLAEQTLEAAAACSGKMRDLRKVLTGTLRIGSTRSFGNLVIDTSRRFIKEYPGVHLKIYTKPAADLLAMLRAKEIDMALAYKSLEIIEDVESELLFQTCLSAVMSKDHPLADRKSLKLEELDRHGIVLPGMGLQARHAVERFVGLDTTMLDARVELNDSELIMDLVESSRMVALISPLAAYYRPKLTSVSLEDGKYTMKGCVHRLKQGYRKKSADIFKEMLLESAHIERLRKGL